MPSCDKKTLCKGIPNTLIILYRICARVVIENMEEDNKLGIVLTPTGFYTQWECAKHAIYLIITKYIST